jgi:FkbM family methyltransferase
MSHDAHLGVEDLRAATARMRAFVDRGDWESAPWAEGGFTAHFIETVKRSKMVVDLGAEVGFYSYLALKNLPVGGRVVAFEIEPNRCAVLTELFSQFSNATLYARAVDAVSGVRQFVRPAEHPCATLADLEGERFEIRSVPLDDVLAHDTVDVIKMDIEGAEVTALQGMKTILARDKPKLYFEVHPELIQRIKEGGLRQMEELFHALNYRLFNGDYGVLVPTSRIVGSRLFACHQSSADTVTSEFSESLLARSWLKIKVQFGLRVRRLLREFIAGY